MKVGRNLNMLAGVGLGATLMYFLDPRGGRRRRALMRDKSIKVSRKTRESVTGHVHDFRNRMRGAAHEIGLVHGEDHSASRRTAVARHA